MAQGFITNQADRSVPGSADASMTDDTILGCVYTCGGSGAQTVSELGFFCSRDSTLGYFKFGIYNVDGSNNPTTLVGQSAEVQAPASEGWLTDAVSISVTGGATYAICIWPEDNQLNVRDYLATDGTAFTSSTAQHGSSYDTWPSNFTHTDVTYQSGLYALYAASGGATLTINIYDSLNQTEALD